MGYKVIILFFYIFSFSISNAQKHQLKLGVGNYEGLNVGMRHSNSKFDFEYGLGTDFNVFNQGDFLIMHHNENNYSSNKVNPQ